MGTYMTAEESLARSAARTAAEHKARTAPAELTYDEVVKHLPEQMVSDLMEAGHLLRFGMAPRRSKAPGRRQ